MRRRKKTGIWGLSTTFFAVVDDLYNRNIAVALITSLRYTSKTTALIGMSKFVRTCHIEIPLLRNFAENSKQTEAALNVSSQESVILFFGPILFSESCKAKDPLK